jgi:translation initiation factor 4G
LGQEGKTCPEDENVEAICQFFNTIGKQLDVGPKSRRVNDVYFGRLKELTTNPQLPSRLRFMVRNVIDLRANNWIPRREEVNFPFLVNSISSLFIVYFSFGGGGG